MKPRSADPLRDGACDSTDHSKTGVSAPSGVGAVLVIAATRGLARANQLGGVLAAHRAAALAAALRADAGLAFLFLLVGLAPGFLALRFGKTALLLRLGVVFRGSGLVQRDGDGLLAALHLAALAPATALQLAMLELMHDAAFRLPLPW